MAGNHYEGPNLAPPDGGFGCGATPNAEKMGTKGWSGLYWTRKTAGGDYEIRTLTREGEACSYPAGLSPREAFERIYERVDPGDTGARE